MICAYCKGDLESASGVACATCTTPLHVECAMLNGGRCVTFGCESRSFDPSPTPGKRRLEPAMPLSFAMRRGALAAFSVFVPSFEDAAMAALAIAGVTGIAFLTR